MAILTAAELEKRLEQGSEGTGTCRAVDRARIIIPTACEEVIGFTNPDDLDVRLLERWKNGERGPEFENQQLKPGDCLVMYNNGRNINQLLEQYPDWHTSVQGIKDMIELLYSCVEAGGKNTEPAIWNSDLNWAKKVNLRTTDEEEVTESMWAEKAGVALEVIKFPPEQKFVHIDPGDVLITEETQPNGKVVQREQTAGAMSAIAVQQPGGTWNIVQLNAKGYEVVTENHPEREKTAHASHVVSDLLAKAIALNRASERARKALKNPEALTYKDLLDAEAEQRANASMDLLKQKYDSRKQK